MGDGGPRLLLLETSGRVGRVALAAGETLLRECRLDEARRHARDLAPAVAELLRAEGWAPREVEGLIVSRGPGSYTGLRVGIMSAKAFSYATGCRLVAVDTFQAVALQAGEGVECVDVLADAQQGRVYVQRFCRDPGAVGVTAVTPLAIRPLAEWLAAHDGRAWVSGPWLRQHRARLPDGLRVVDSGRWEPQPEGLLRLGLARYRAGEGEDPWALEPLYLRPSAAEEQWDRLPARPGKP
jgi:tRNA threonylcarbamoyladenosine biosynthesis protein TsaB